MNTYQEMQLRQQQEFNTLPLGFAFNKDQFDKMMRGWGLHPERDVKKICSIGAGGYIQKKDVELCAAPDGGEQGRGALIAGEGAGQPLRCHDVSCQRLRLLAVHGFIVTDGDLQF